MKGKVIMKKLLAIITVLILTVSIVNACGASRETEQKEEKVETSALYLDINFEENLFLNKYGVCVDLNGERLKDLKHGEYFTHMAKVPHGNCTILFQNTEKSEVKASKTLTVKGDMTYKCTIHTDGDEIVIKDEEVIEGIEGSKITMPDVVGNNLETSKEELKTLGFVNVENKANDDSTILMDSNWVVIEQSINSGTEIDKNDQIVLTCRKEADLFSEEYKGMNLAEASKKAADNGFTILELKEDAAYSNVTKLLAKISDEEKTKWIVTDAGKASDNKARLILSYSGEVTVPDVVGLSVKDAKKALRKQYAFNVEANDPETIFIQDETWEVKEQSIENGKKIKYSDKVTLTCKEIKTKSSKTKTETSKEKDNNAGDNSSSGSQSYKGAGPTDLQEWGMKNLDSTFRINLADSWSDISGDEIIIRGTCSWKENGSKVSDNYCAIYDLDGNLKSLTIGGRQVY